MRSSSIDCFSMLLAWYGNVSAGSAPMPLHTVQLAAKAAAPAGMKPRTPTLQMHCSRANDPGGERSRYACTIALCCSRLQSGAVVRCSALESDVAHGDRGCGALCFLGFPGQSMVFPCARWGSPRACVPILFCRHAWMGSRQHPNAIFRNVCRHAWRALAKT